MVPNDTEVEHQRSPHERGIDRIIYILIYCAILLTGITYKILVIGL